MTVMFKDIYEDMPVWQELGRRVEAVRADGSSVIGPVVAIDMSTSVDEWPILGIEVDGKELSWQDFEKWRYV